MPLEIERKFLMAALPAELPPCKEILQGYLQTDPNKSVRVRITSHPNGTTEAHLTIKGKALPGHFARNEFEYKIPAQDAEILLQLCEHPPISKKRYIYKYDKLIWELDLFEGDNKGLLLAEVELETETDLITLPSFIAEEVTGNPHYFNLYLAFHPYTTWKQTKKEPV